MNPLRTTQEKMPFPRRRKLAEPESPIKFTVPLTVKRNPSSLEKHSNRWKTLSQMRRSPRVLQAQPSNQNVPANQKKWADKKSLFAKRFLCPLSPHAPNCQAHRSILVHPFLPSNLLQKKPQGSARKRLSQQDFTQKTRRKNFTWEIKITGKLIPGLSSKIWYLPWKKFTLTMCTSLIVTFQCGANSTN